MCRPKFAMLLCALFLVLCVCAPAEAAGRFNFGSRLNFHFFRHNTTTTTTPPAAEVKAKEPVAKEAAPTSPTKQPTKVTPDDDSKDGPKHKTAALDVGSIKLTPGEINMLDGINKIRVSRGVAPAAMDKDLMLSARAHAIKMARQNSMYHGGFRGPETVAMNSSNTGAAIMQWLRSGPHYSILINPYNRRVGVAGYVGSNGRSYYVSQFAK